MVEFIKPTSVVYCRGPMGYTVELVRKDTRNKVAARVSLGSVIDVSYTKARDLGVLLEGFLKDQASIILDNKEVLESRMLSVNFRQKRILRELEEVNKEAAVIREALDTLDG